MRFPAGQREALARRLEALGMPGAAEYLRDPAKSEEQALAVCLRISRWADGSTSMVHDEVCWALALAGVPEFSDSIAPDLVA